MVIKWLPVSNREERKKVDLLDSDDMNYGAAGVSVVRSRRRQITQLPELPEPPDQQTNQSRKGKKIDDFSLMLKSRGVFTNKEQAEGLFAAADRLAEQHVAAVLIIYTI